MKREMELVTDAGIAIRLRKKPSSVEAACKGAVCFPANWFVTRSEQKDRPKQTKKRMVKLKWLIRSIPMAGAKAEAKVMDSEK